VTASSLILLGLYCSAISISADTRLRQLIRKSVLDETKLLGNIGAAQTKIETEKRIVNIVKEHSDTINEQTGVQPSLTEEDIKHYLDDVLGEIQRKR
jgi:hypothetical protein